MFALSAVPFLVVPLLVGAVGSDAVPAAGAPSASAAAPTNPAAAQVPLELDEPATVTLVTGDKVTMRPDGSVTTKPGPSRDDVVFDERKLGDEVHVVPSDAAQLLAEGKLDKRLFNITYLIREGYDDANRGDMPLIIEGKADDIRDVAKGRGAKVKRHSPKLNMSVVAQNKKKDKGGLWSRVTRNEEAPESLPAGVNKIWLDGMAHLTLDESVPQIGAPQAWGAGYTGAGVTVAVLDTGVDSTHPDLADQVVAEKSFVDNPRVGAFLADQVDFPLAYTAVFGAADVPAEGASDALAYIGRACVETEGDELEADPSGKTALVLRGACNFAEKYDAAVEAGATAVVFSNNEPGILYGSVFGAEHAGDVWAAIISDDHGQAVRDAMAVDDVTLTFTDHFAGDLFGHGTHVASTIAGTGAASDGLRKGVAPDADIMNGKVCDIEGSCRESWMIAGMEWAATNGADVVNMSLSGNPTDGTDPVSQAVNILTTEHDVLFVISAGNMGEFGYGSVGLPGAADAALTVGAVDKNDELTWFSSRGPRRGDFMVKPELTAPGAGIVAARAGGTTMGTPVDADYTAANGTSMAAPHVAGAAALLVQARPDFGAEDVKNALASTTTPGEYLWYEQGTGRVDVFRAVTQGVYADAAIGFGSLSSDDSVVERDITYVNTSDHVVTLHLGVSVTDLDGNPVDAATMSKKHITVRPGQEKSVSITIDPQAIDTRPGPHGGVVTARADGVHIRTALGLHLQRTVVPLTDNWNEEWAKSYDYFSDNAHVKLQGAALTPDGQNVILAGGETVPDPRIIVTSIDTSSGEEAWRTELPVVGLAIDLAGGLVISPDGDRIYLSMDTWDAKQDQRDIVTIAYNNKPPTNVGDPELGEILWRASHPSGCPSRGLGGLGGEQIAVSPDGSTVLVVANISPTNNCHRDSEALTLAYDSTTGEKEWVARHTSPIVTMGMDIAISPIDDVAYVTGWEKLDADPDTADVRPFTIAYALGGESAGEPLWVTRHDSVTGYWYSWHNSVSDDGKRVFVAATLREGDASGWRMGTHALDASTGEVLWTSQFSATDHGFAPGRTAPPESTRGSAIATSPDNDLMFVTGSHCRLMNGCVDEYAMVTVAYDQQTGEEVWFQIHGGVGIPLGGDATRPAGRSVAISPDGSQLYVTGGCCWKSNSQPHNGEHVTIAYDAASGERLAVARHQYVSDEFQTNQGYRVFASPDGASVYSVANIFADEYGWAVSKLVPPIPLEATTRRLRGNWLVDLAWSVAATEQVDVYRDDDLIATVDNTGTYTDDLGRQRPGTIVEYRVCASETQHCSKPAIVELSVGRPSPVE